MRKNKQGEEEEEEEEEEDLRARLPAASVVISALGKALDFGTGSERGARSEDKSWQEHSGSTFPCI